MEYAKGYQHILNSQRAHGALMEYCGRREFIADDNGIIWAKKDPAQIKHLNDLIEQEDQGNERVSDAEHALLNYCSQEGPHDPAKIKHLEDLVKQERQKLDQLIDAGLSTVPPPLH